ncbi:MAG TPA: DEAD/DEAH box helicase, partial [Polyangiaceae bacterium]
ELAAWYGGPIGCWGDARRETTSVTVATFESGVRRAAELGALFELIVVDEVHHFGDKLRDEALEMSVAPMRLGLTATPPEEPTQLQRLTDLVGPVQFELSIADLAGTYLAAYDVVVFHARLSAEEWAQYRAERAVFARTFRALQRTSPGASWSEFVAVATRTDEGRRALAAWRRTKQMEAFPEAKRTLLAELLDRHRDRRVLVFTPDNASAYEIAREHFIMPLTCDIKRKERETVLERFRKGELGALASSRVLNEGLDVPDADVAIIVGGSLGDREHIQRVGRLLRPSLGKRAVIYELVASGTSETRSSLRRRRALATRTVPTV